MEEDKIIDAVKKVNKKQWFTVPRLWEFGDIKYNYLAVGLM